jgi:hypothetical protein
MGCDSGSAGAVDCGLKSSGDVSHSQARKNWVHMIPVRPPRRHGRNTMSSHLASALTRFGRPMTAVIAYDVHFRLAAMVELYRTI